MLSIRTLRRRDLGAPIGPSTLGRLSPRPISEPYGLAGGKIAKIDRIEWLAISDHQQAVNALLAGLAIQLQAIAEQGLVGGGAAEPEAEAPAEPEAEPEPAEQTEQESASDEGA